MKSTPDNMRSMFTNTDVVAQRVAMEWAINLVTDKYNKATKLLAETSFIALPKTVNTFGRLTTIQ